MAKGEKNAVYRVTDVIGTSAVSAGRRRAQRGQDGVQVAARPAHSRGDQARRQGQSGKVTQFRTRLSLSFKYSSD